jgi:hypothetical protein
MTTAAVRVIRLQRDPGSDTVQAIGMQRQELLIVRAGTGVPVLNGDGLAQ